jgi:hypothetical protein
MLRGELIRLGQEAARTMEEGERLRSEVGELKTARLSAEAVAARLEEMNALSIRVSEGGWGRQGCLLLTHQGGCRLCAAHCRGRRSNGVPPAQQARRPVQPRQHPCLLRACDFQRKPSAPAAAASGCRPAPAQVASLKLEIAALKSEQDIREDELLAQIAVLQQQLARKKKKRSPGKMLKRMLSSAGESIKGLQGQPHAASPPPPGPEASPGAGSELRRSWGSLKSKFGKA